MDITIDKEVTFELPEGVYKATLKQVRPFHKQAAKGKQDWVRLVFEVLISGMENLECRAGRNFPANLKPGSDLRNFLEPVLGPDFFKKNSAKTIDLETIAVGLEGYVTLSHFCGDDYEKPLVVVEAFELGKEKD